MRSSPALSVCGMEENSTKVTSAPKSKEKIRAASSFSWAIVIVNHTMQFADSPSWIKVIA